MAVIVSLLAPAQNYPDVRSLTNSVGVALRRRSDLFVRLEPPCRCRSRRPARVGGSRPSGPCRRPPRRLPLAEDGGSITRGTGRYGCAPRSYHPAARQSPQRCTTLRRMHDPVPAEKRLCFRGTDAIRPQWCFVHLVERARRNATSGVRRATRRDGPRRTRESRASSFSRWSGPTSKPSLRPVNRAPRLMARWCAGPGSHWPRETLFTPAFLIFEFPFCRYNRQKSPNQHPSGGPMRLARLLLAAGMCFSTGCTSRHLCQRTVSQGRTLPEL